MSGHNMSGHTLFGKTDKCNVGLTMIDQKNLLIDLFLNHNMSGDINIMAKPVLSRCTSYDFCHNCLDSWRLSLAIIVLIFSTILFVCV